MSSNPVEIGMRIKEARKAANLTQTELANRLNKTMRTIQKYESGEVQPSISMIEAISNELDVSATDLLGYRKPDIQLKSLSDIITVLYQLDKKSGLRFEIDVNGSQQSGEWSCSLSFKGNDPSAPLNFSLCQILENFRDKRDKRETFWIDQESFDLWVQKETNSYADLLLVNY